MNSPGRAWPTTCTGNWACSCSCWLKSSAMSLMQGLSLRLSLSSLSARLELSVASRGSPADVQGQVRVYRG